MLCSTQRSNNLPSREPEGFNAIDADSRAGYQEQTSSQRESENEEKSERVMTAPAYAV